MEQPRDVDLAIVGGGLAGGLIALAIAEARPDARLLLIEGGERLGGNHVWSFFDSDIALADRSLVLPLADHRWEGYEVAFPRRRRALAARYNAITSEAYDARLRARLGQERILTGVPAREVAPDSVTLADGRRIRAAGVIDARGGADLAPLSVGWQKFVGQELRLDAPHGLLRPIIMDATVDQIDGFRFVYVLPFGPDRLFVEDTYYSDTPDCDRATLAGRIAAYADRQGWRVIGAGREEQGALPVVLDGDFAAYWRGSGEGVAKAGARAGLFHPTTGYSLPEAVRTARLVAGLADWRAPALHAALHDHARRCWDRGGFYRMLDRLLFRAAEPAQRFRVFQRFYGLDEGLIGRFYASRSTLADKARILTGRPPVPVGRAVAALMRG